MKKNFRNLITRKCFFKKSFSLTLLFVCLGSPSFAELRMEKGAAPTKEAPKETVERAVPKENESIDPNSLLAFKKMYIYPVEDNVEGALKAPIEAAYREVFERNKRFEMTTNKDDADSALKFTVTKKTSGLDIAIEMTLMKTGEVFSNDQTTIPAIALEDEIRTKTKDLLKTTLKHIPFYGSVSGRDGTQVTLDIGSANGLKKGDIVQISRIGIIKRHPLLKTILDVEVVPIGSVELTTVEETIAFGTVYKEFEGEAIKRLHKVTSIEARKIEEKTDVVKKTNGVRIHDEAGGKETSKIGLVGLGVFVGGFSSSTSTGNGTQNFSGAAFNPGARLNGEIWFTKNWFADLNLGYSAMSIRQYDDSVAQPDNIQGVNSTTTSFGFNAGYRFLPDGNVFGPQLNIKLGYYHFKWDTSVLQEALMGPKSYGGLNLGFSGSLPLTTYDQGLTLGLNFLLFPSLTEDGYLTGSPGSGSVTVIGFNLGGYYFLNRDIAIRASIIFEIYSADFGDSTSKASTSQKEYGLLPSLVYYF